MTTFTVQESTLPVIKSCLKFKWRLLNLKLQIYTKKLQRFEKRYNMPTAKFLKELEAGNISDRAYVIEWEYLAESYRSLSNQLKQIQQIKI